MSNAYYALWGSIGYLLGGVLMGAPLTSFDLMISAVLWVFFFEFYQYIDRVRAKYDV